MSVTYSAGQATVPVTAIKVGDEVLDAAAQSLVINRVYGRHEECVLNLLVGEADPQRWTDSPITFRWGPGRERFVGYVGSVTKPQEFQGQPGVALTCYGPTWAMAQGQPRFWTDVTITEVVSSLCQGHRLGVDVDDHWYHWPRLGQTGESDWAMVLKVADILGYVVFPQQGVVRVVDPVKLIKNSTPYVRLDKTTTELATNQLLYDFIPKTTSETDRNQTQPSYGYFLADGSVKKVNGDSTMWATDFIESEAKARLAQERLVRAQQYWSQVGEARCRGIAQIHPGMTVDVHTGSSQTVKDSNDGIWLVMQVTHSLDNKSLQTNLGLARDKIRASAQAANAQMFWTAKRKAEPNLLLTNGKWVSSWR